MPGPQEGSPHPTPSLLRDPAGGPEADPPARVAFLPWPSPPLTMGLSMFVPFLCSPPSSPTGEAPLSWHLGLSAEMLVLKSPLGSCQGS